MDNDQYGSRFLYSEDLIIGGEYAKPTLEISEVYERNTIPSVKNEGSFIDQRVISFKGKSKLLGINHNMERVLQAVTGEPFGKGWIGKKVRLEVREIIHKGKPSPAIRVMPIVGQLLRPNLIISLGKPLNLIKAAK